MDLEKAKERFIDYLLATNKAKNTILAYRRDLDQLIHYLKEFTQIEEITKEQLVGFMIYLAKKELTGKTRARKVCVVKTFFRYLSNQGYVPQNPAKNLEIPKVEQREPRVLSQTEYQALRNSAKGNTKYSAIIELLLQTGTRIGELVAIKLENVHFGNHSRPGHIMIEQGKGKKDRIITLNTPGKKAIKKYLGIRPKSNCPYLFLSKSGKPLNSRNIRHAIDRYYRKVGIRRATVHTLRHTFCTHHVAKGTSLMVIARMAGHSKLTTTQKYIHLTTEVMDEQIEKNAL